jgi:hypothetical protein
MQTINSIINKFYDFMSEKKSGSKHYSHSHAFPTAKRRELLLDNLWEGKMLLYIFIIAAFEFFFPFFHALEFFFLVIQLAVITQYT